MIILYMEGTFFQFAQTTYFQPLLTLSIQSRKCSC